MFLDDAFLSYLNVKLVFLFFSYNDFQTVKKGLFEFFKRNYYSKQVSSNKHVCRYEKVHLGVLLPYLLNGNIGNAITAGDEDAWSKIHYYFWHEYLCNIQGFLKIYLLLFKRTSTHSELFIVFVDLFIIFFYNFALVESCGNDRNSDQTLKSYCFWLGHECR